MTVQTADAWAPAQLDFEAPLVGAVIEDPSVLSRVVAALESADMGGGLRLGSPQELATSADDVRVGILHETGGGIPIADGVRAFREHFPTARVIVICDPTARPGARRAMRAGADSILNDSTIDETLVPAIGAVLSGQICVATGMRGQLEEERLSMREKQILGLIVMGLSNAEIAQKLFVAESTVKSHLSSAYRKLGVRSRKDAASIILDPTEGFGPGILAISAA